ncbi:Retrovirus-related Pol polyprotein from transposon [Trichinella sp. T8]|nr:Retrovirus-related Pol polyprotein from transposon [Trichinella sp. T8]
MGKEMTTCKYVEELAAHIRNAFAATRKHSVEEQKRQRYYYNRKAGNTNYQTHEAVWLYCPVNKGKRNMKFATPCTGPFEIIEQVSGVNYRIRSFGSPRRTQLVHVNRLKRSHAKNATQTRNKNDVTANSTPSRGHIAHDWCGLKKTVDWKGRQHQQCDVDEKMALTPAHFLIGRSLASFPDRSNSADRGTLRSSLRHLLRRENGKGYTSNPVLATWCWLLTTILHDAVGPLVESLSCSLAVTGWQGLQRRSTVGQITSSVRGGGESRVKGAVLSQKHDPEGERVIAYASRTLSKTERMYWTMRKELLSIRFTLRTDHDSLTWLRNFKEPEGQVARWLEHLQEYDMKVVHRRGRQHNNADAMSRGPEVTEDNEDHPTTEMPSAAVGTAAVSLASNEGAEPLEAPQDENIECVIRFLRRGRRPTDSEWRELHKDSRDLVKQWKHLRLTPAGLAVVVTGKPARWVPPNHARLSILEQLHNGIGGGHLGVKKTAEKVRSRYFWPGWYRDVKAWCDRCEACARGKTKPIVNRAPMESLVVGNPMEIVAVELLRPAPRSKNGNSYIMVVTDYFTRWVEAYALPNQQAETVARKLMQQFVCRFGTSMKLLSDQGKQFQGRLVPKLCKVLGNEKIRTTA